MAQSKSFVFPFKMVIFHNYVNLFTTGYLLLITINHYYTLLITFKMMIPHENAKVSHMLSEKKYHS